MTPDPVLKANDDGDLECPKCGAVSGDDWSQCKGVCPVECSPHFDLQTRMTLKAAPRRPMLDRLLAQAKEWDRTATPEERATMFRAQRRSWAIGELMLACPDLTREEAERRIDDALSNVKG